MRTRILLTTIVALATLSPTGCDLEPDRRDRGKQVCIFGAITAPGCEGNLAGDSVSPGTTLETEEEDR